MNDSTSPSDDVAVPISEIGPLLALVESTSAGASLGQTIGALKKQRERMAIGHFALRLEPNTKANTGTFDGVWSYPRGWNRVFIANRYGLSSPALRAARVRRRPFNWFELLANPNLLPIQRRMFAEGADYGIGTGLTVPVHAPDGSFAAISLCSNPTIDPTADTIRANSWALTLLGLGFVELTRPRLCGRAIALADFDLFGPPGNDNEPLAMTKRPGDASDLLSTFERDCLSFSSAGESAWEISERFHLSQASVDRAFESARLKLQAGTRTHAVVKAIIERLIAP